jgi:hypothetical protein
METRKLTPSKVKFIILFLGSMVFVIGGFLLVKGDNVGWLTILFFGICAIISALQLVPGANWLCLDNDGFTIRNLYRVHRYLWKDIQEFGTININLNKMVAFNFVSDFDRSKVGRRVSRSLSGFEGALPNTYGLKAEELIQLMKKYKYNSQTTVQKTPPPLPPHTL